jgi:tetratricopeptide (TPR) repeat protein
MYTEDFSDDIAADDHAVLGKLKSGSAGWQAKLAKRMVADASASSVRHSQFRWRWVMAPTALAACALIALSTWYIQRETPEKVEKLLAQAYTEKRPIEMRFAGAAWAPMQLTRGPEGSSKPEPLLEAELIISRKQPANPDNTDWLQAKAEAELLDGQPEAAIATLARALQVQPDSVPLMLDLSIAYEQQQNYGKAIDLLTKIIQSQPNNHEALFNLALARSRAGQWGQAVTAWEAYLRIDPTGPWAVEAREKLDLVKSKLLTGS